MSSLEIFTAVGREKRRRARLHAEIGALERKLTELGPQPIGLRRERAYRLASKIKRLRAELDQPELPL